ncbi:MAG: prepilin peptidase [Myxococcales bacterium]|nr:prepilin peptidase [Myxococcales bacterium]
MPTLADLPPWFIVGTVVALGLAFGSFLNVVIYRLPRGQNLAHPPSRCPACGKSIRAFDNIPVFGWLLLLGKARCCGARISPRYPLVEALGGLAAWAVFEVRVAPLPPDTVWWRALFLFLPYFALALGLIAAAFIDLEHMILPDEITLGGTLLGVLSVPLRHELTWVESITGAAIGFVMIWLPFDVLYRKLRGRAGMGLGDAKLTMLAGAWFGWQGAVFALLAGAVQGTIAAIVVFVAQGKIEEPDAVKREREELMQAITEAETEEERAELEAELELDPIGHEAEPGLGQSRLAFGPFLVLATLEFMLFGRVIVDTYLAYVWVL